MPTDLLQQAGLLYKHGDKAQARKLLLELTQQEPTNARSWYGLALCEDNVQKKSEYLSRAISIDPNHTQARKLLEETRDQISNSPTPNETINQPASHSISANQGQPSSDLAKVKKKSRPNERPRQNKAGKSTSDMAKKRRVIGFVIGIVAMIIMAIVALYVFPHAQALGLSSIALAIIFILVLLTPQIIDFFFLDPISKKWKRAVRGAEAEEEIGKMLDSLGENYLVLNDIVSPNGNIDHIVIGKDQGVFLIETKSHHGKVGAENGKLLVNGKPPEKDFITQTLKNTYWLRDEIGEVIGISPWITPVIVFTNAFVERMKPIKGITVVNKKFLPSILQRQAGPNAAQVKIWEMKDEITNEIVG